MNRTRFRHNISICIAGIVAFLGAIPLATAGFGTHRSTPPPWAYPLLVILIIPLAVAVWGARAGTDADVGGLRLRALVGSRRLPWSRISALVPQGRQVLAVLTDGHSIVLPAVTRDDLPRLIAASGQQLATGELETTDQPESADQ